jgi:hypothetical protein
MLAIENRRSRCCRFMASEIFKVLTSSKFSKMLRFCTRQSALNEEKERVIGYVVDVINVINSLYGFHVVCSHLWFRVEDELFKVFANRFARILVDA